MSDQRNEIRTTLPHVANEAKPGESTPVPEDATTQANVVRRKNGFQPYNKDGMRHGLRSGQLPVGAGYVKRETENLRRELERAITVRKGEVDLFDAALIQSAMRWERHALLAQRWLRQSCKDMNHIERLAYSREIAKASQQRDKCLRELGLPKKRDDDLLDALYLEESPDPDQESKKQ